MSQSFWIVIVIILATFFTRVLPFVIFKTKAPRFILYLGKVLPSAIIAMLVIYCFKSIQLLNSPYGLNEVVAFLCVAILQIIFKISVLSIVVGTILYMYLLQTHILEKIF